MRVSMGLVHDGRCHHVTFLMMKTYASGVENDICCGSPEHPQGRARVGSDPPAPQGEDWSQSRSASAGHG